MKNIGVEICADYTFGKLRCMGNASWKHLLEYKEFLSDEEDKSGGECQYPQPPGKGIFADRKQHHLQAAAGAALAARGADL